MNCPYNNEMIRQLFDDLTEGKLAPHEVDLSLHDLGISIDTRDGMFLLHDAYDGGLARQDEPPPNLLRNPSFSGEYSPRGAPELKLAPGWNLCYRHDEPSPLGPQDKEHFCVRPEYKPVSRWEFPGRVVWGEKAQLAFTRWKVMDACIYQRVAVPVGTTLTLQADVQAWCSNDDNPASCDGEFYFRLGIDLKGNYSFFEADEDSSLIWGDWIRATNEYQTIEMQAVTQAPYVTCYVNFWNKYRYAHNDAYIDRVGLTATGPAPGPEPEPSEYVTHQKLAELLHELADELEYPT